MIQGVMKEWTTQIFDRWMREGIDGGDIKEERMGEECLGKKRWLRMDRAREKIIKRPPQHEDGLFLQDRFSSANQSRGQRLDLWWKANDNTHSWQHQELWAALH